MWCCPSYTTCIATRTQKKTWRTMSSILESIKMSDGASLGSVVEEFKRMLLEPTKYLVRAHVDLKKADDTVLIGCEELMKGIRAGEIAYEVLAGEVVPYYDF